MKLNGPPAAFQIVDTNRGREIRVMTNSAGEQVLQIEFNRLRTDAFGIGRLIQQPRINPVRIAAVPGSGGSIKRNPNGRNGTSKEFDRERSLKTADGKRFSTQTHLQLF